MAKLIVLLLLTALVASQEFTLKEGLLNGILPFHDDYILRLAREYHSKISVQDKEYENFKQNVQTVRNHNQKTNTTYTLGIDGPFAFISDEEFFANYLGSQDCSATAEYTTKYPMKLEGMNAKVPDSKNWTNLNKVSPVKDQQSCGSCWAFSSTGAIESHYAIYEGVEPTSLSEQQLLDCAGAFENYGCSGGLPSQAFEYIKQAKGIAFENSYFYEAVQQSSCLFDPTTVGARVKGGSFNITQGDEDQLKQAVGLVGPVSVAFQVKADFKLYESGVYSNKDCSSSPQSVNHAVLATGYGTTSLLKKYWYVKNSWSQYWGEYGYFKIQRGVNMCGIATCASYPILQGSETEEDNSFDSIFANASNFSA